MQLQEQPTASGLAVSGQASLEQLAQLDHNLLTTWLPSLACLSPTGLARLTAPHSFFLACHDSQMLLCLYLCMIRLRERRRVRRHVEQEDTFDHWHSVMLERVVLHRVYLRMGFCLRQRRASLRSVLCLRLSCMLL